MSQKAIEGTAIVEFLASPTLNDCQPLNFKLDEDLMNILAEEEGKLLKESTWKMYFDRAQIFWMMELG